MPDQIIYPFRGLRYDVAKAHDLSLLIAPPFDVITREMQEELYAREPHNFVRLELPRDGATDSETENRYTRAAETLRTWRTEGVLVREEAPALYLVETEFPLNGRTWRRRGAFALVRIPEEGEDYVLGHEATFSGPKADRFQLMRATHAMISPVMALCEDVDGRVLSALRAVNGSPDAVATEADGVAHRVWIVRDKAVTSAVAKAVGGGPLYIADGHHRFDTARAYRDEMRRAHPDAGADAGFDFALVLLLSAQDEAVRIRPVHRLASGLEREDVEWVVARLSERFELRPRPVPPWDQLEELLEAEADAGGRVFACYGADGSFAMLSAKQELLAPSDSPVDQLDVAVLHRVLLDPLAQRGLEETAPGGAQSRAGRRISYEPDATAAAAGVARGEYDFAFFLRPTRVDQVIAVARAGGRTPRKATYFHPKAPAGLVISDFSDEPI